MEVTKMMTCKEMETSVYQYDVDNRKITLSKDIVDRYSDIVCPVTENLLSGLILIFGKDVDGKINPDDVLSCLIATDMVKDINDYTS